VIGDDHTLVVEGLCRLLEAAFDVVGTAGDGESLVREALRLRPDAVLVDISLPLLNGIEAARLIKRALPEVKIIFLTMHADLTYLRDAVRLGASAYVLKRSAGKELLKALREALQGRVYVTPYLTSLVQDPKLRKALERGQVRALTARQRDILRLIASGHSNSEIAALLKVTVRTVRLHRSVIVRKLAVSTTAEMTRYAIEHGIIPR
jgi:DNA-binding NarL/FixJ family response regulator